MVKEKSKQSFYAEDLAWLKETCPYEARSHADRLRWLKIACSGSRVRT